MEAPQLALWDLGTRFGAKACEYCGAVLTLRCRRDIERKHFCSHACRQRGRAARGEFFRRRVCEPGADPMGSWYERNRNTVLAGQAQRYRDDEAFRDAKKQRAAERNERLQAERQPYIDAARATGCVDCGWKDVPQALEFDHVHGPRRFSVPGAGGATLEVFLAEMAKCEVRCPTCHRLRHMKERSNAVE
jgi:hypothetical protein